MEESRKNKISTQALRTSIRETGTRETSIRETGARMTGTRETGIRETSIREPSIRETGRDTDFGPKSISRLKLRRTSFGFASVPGIKPVERTSQVGMEFRRPPLLYLNTYQLDPRFKFDNGRVELETNKILDNTFTGHKYNEQESPVLALRIAAEVMRKIKSLNFNRYRIITIVTIAQKRAQSYNNAICFLWDYERDGYVDLMREGKLCGQLLRYKNVQKRHRRCKIETSRWEDLAAQRSEWRETVKGRVLEFEDQRKAGLDAKRDELKARPPTAIKCNYPNDVLKCRYCA